MQMRAGGSVTGSFESQVATVRRCTVNKAEPANPRDWWLFAADSSTILGHEMLC